MKKDGKKAPELVWNREERTLTLEGEPVLHYAIAWPELRGAGLGGRWISGYYAHMAKSWCRRWQREVYWRACVRLSQLRAASRPFVPWEGNLEGEVTFWKGGKLSIRMRGRETREDGKPCRVQWGDVWDVRAGAPCPAADFFDPRRRWRRRAMDQITARGEERRRAGECFLDPDWTERAPGLLPRDFALLPDGLEFAFPQGSIAPPEEGTPVFHVRTE